MITPEEKKLQESLTIDEIVFAIPAQRFSVSCSISAEEALPVVTEFALRIAFVCGTISSLQLQEFFGFTPKETEAVLNSLLKERLLQWNEDEQLELTQYAHQRFQDSSDNLPRFFKIEEWSAEVVFDLISFSPAGRGNPLKRLRSHVELASSVQDKQSRTLPYAEQAFQQNFRHICNKAKAEIYKISAIDAGERFSIPLACKFHLDLSGVTSLRRDISDESFGERLEIAQAITDAMSNSERASNERLADFIRLFDVELLRRYAKADTFDLRGYVLDVHLARSAKPNDPRVTPVLGALHLQDNARLLFERLRMALKPTTGSDLHPSEATVAGAPLSPDADSAAQQDAAMAATAAVEPALEALWWAPQSSLWARHPGVRQFVQKLEELLQAARSSPPVHCLNAVVPSVGRSPRETLHPYQDSFPRLFASTTALLDGNLEVIIIPGHLVCAMYHFHLAHQALAVPIGFISSVPEQIQAVASMLAFRLKGNAGAFTFGQKDGGAQAVQELIGLGSRLILPDLS